MMVDTQVRPSDVTKFPIIDAMLHVPKEVFVPQRLKEAAYVGETLDIGDGRHLLEPRTLAKMLDVLAIEPTDVVLDIGCGFDNAVVIEGPLTNGSEKSGPYDVIIVEGSVETIPDSLLAQLRDGGRIAAVFSEGALGVVRIGHKNDGDVSWRFAFNASAPVLAGFEKTAAFAL